MDLFVAEPIKNYVQQTCIQSFQICCCALLRILGEFIVFLFPFSPRGPEAVGRVRSPPLAHGSSGLASSPYQSAGFSR